MVLNVGRLGLALHAAPKTWSASTPSRHSIGVQEAVARVKAQVQRYPLDSEEELELVGVLEPLNPTHRAQVVHAVSAMGPKVYGFDLVRAAKMLAALPQESLTGLHEVMRAFVAVKHPSDGSPLRKLFDVYAPLSSKRRSEVQRDVLSLMNHPELGDRTSFCTFESFSELLGSLTSEDQAAFVAVLKRACVPGTHGNMLSHFAQALLDVPEEQRGKLIDLLVPWGPKHLDAQHVANLMRLPEVEWAKTSAFAAPLRDVEGSLAAVVLATLCAIEDPNERQQLGAAVKSLSEAFTLDWLFTYSLEALCEHPPARWESLARHITASKISYDTLDDVILALKSLPESQWARFLELAPACVAAAGPKSTGSVVALAKVPEHDRETVLQHFESLKRCAGAEAITLLTNLTEEARPGACCAVRALMGDANPTSVEQFEKPFLKAIGNMDAATLQALEAVSRDSDDAVITACIDHLVTKRPLDAGWSRVPYAALWPLRDRIQARLEAHYPETLEALADKAFDRNNSLHVHVGALAWILQQHAFKHVGTSSDEPFDYDACVKLVTDDVKRPASSLTPAEVAESWYLAYETTLVYEQHVKPAMERAAAMGVPFMLVANVSYGGTAATGLPIRQMQNEGARVVFTKQGSTEAHGTDHVLEPKLFTLEQEEFIAKERPVVLVLDGSNSHYPDGFRGFRNFAALLNQTSPLSSAGAWTQHGVSQAPFVPGEAHLALQARLTAHQRDQQDGLAKPFGMFYASLTHDLISTGFNETPAAFDWSQVNGPVFVCLQTAMRNDDIAARAAAGEARALALLARSEVSGHKHEPVYFDDSAAQSGRAYVGRHGPKVKAILHRDTRDAFKVLVQLLASPPLPPQPRARTRR